MKDRFIIPIILIALSAAGTMVCLEGYRSCRYVFFFGGLLSSSFFMYTASRLKDSFLGKGYLPLIIKRISILAVMLVIAECLFILNNNIAGKINWNRNIKPVYSFREAEGNPQLFLDWWQHYVNEWRKNKYRVEKPTPNLPVPFVLIPNSSTRFFDGTIRINSLGFEDREFDIDKKDKYRIVVMGSSHTFGPVMYEGDFPWPKIMEPMLQAGVGKGRKIEVINAAVETYDIEENLYRLKKDVLPLKPDMIITYFGLNEFPLYYDAYPQLKPRLWLDQGKRASKIFGDIEFRIRMWINNISQERISRFSAESLGNKIYNNKVDKIYREYIKIAKENNIELVLCNFNMAVNRKSPDKAIEFYEIGFPMVRSDIIANEINSLLVKKIAADEKVDFIDTHHGLDGAYDTDRFLDIVHMTYNGKKVLAENISEKVLEILKKQPGRNIISNP